jgi:hypothetical protein
MVRRRSSANIAVLRELGVLWANRKCSGKPRSTVFSLNSGHLYSLGILGRFDGGFGRQ